MNMMACRSCFIVSRFYCIFSHVAISDHNQTHVFPIFLLTIYPKLASLFYTDLQIFMPCLLHILTSPLKYNARGEYARNVHWILVNIHIDKKLTWCKTFKGWWQTLIMNSWDHSSASVRTALHPVMHDVIFNLIKNGSLNPISSLKSGIYFTMQDLKKSVSDTTSCNEQAAKIIARTQQGRNALRQTQGFCWLRGQQQFQP